MTDNGRSLARQTTAELGRPHSVLARQRRDHMQLDDLMQEAAATTGPERQEVLAELCRLVFTHAFAEEAVLWPIVRRTDDDSLLRIGWMWEVVRRTSPTRPHPVVSRRMPPPRVTSAGWRRASPGPSSICRRSDGERTPRPAPSRIGASSLPRAAQGLWGSIASLTFPMRPFSVPIADERGSPREPS